MLFRGLERDVAGFSVHFESKTAEVDRAKFATLSFSQLSSAPTSCAPSHERLHTPIVNDFFVMMASGKLRRLLEKSGLPDAPALLGHLMSGEEASIDRADPPANAHGQAGPR